MNKKALSPVVASIILIAVTVAVSIAFAVWMGATMDFTAEKAKPREEGFCKRVLLFSNETEALQWAIDNVNATLLENVRSMGWMVGYNATRYTIVVEPIFEDETFLGFGVLLDGPTLTGYRVTITFYGVRLP